MAETLIEALAAVGDETKKGYTFLDGNLKPTTWSFAALAREARRRARVFLAAGLKKGDRIGMVIPEPEDFVLSFLGAVSAGIVPVPMPHGRGTSVAMPVSHTRRPSARNGSPPER